MAEGAQGRVERESVATGQKECSHRVEEAQVRGGDGVLKCKVEIVRGLQKVCSVKLDNDL